MSADKSGHAARPEVGPNRDPRTGERVAWAELKPDEFRARVAACPVAWLPFGLCEPHGHVAALGLDLIKAEAFCVEAARRFGGVVAPAQGWHIHETGYHARWLEDVVGEENAMMSSVPPAVVLPLFAYQLRACANAGFRAVFVLTGHAGGNERDLRRVAAAFTAETGLPVEVRADPELVAGKFRSDHAGRFELSQLMFLRPELVELSLLKRRDEPGSGGRLALGDDAAEASEDEGRAICEAIVSAMGEATTKWRTEVQTLRAVGAERVTLAQVEKVWRAVVGSGEPWVTARPYPGQAAVSERSQWRDGERV